MASRKGKDDLDPAEVRSVVDALKYLLEEHHGGSQTSLAKALGMTQPAISQLLHERNKPGLATVKGIAKHLGNVTGKRVTFADLLAGNWREREPMRMVDDSGSGQVVNLSNRRRAMYALAVLGEGRDRVEAAARAIRENLRTKTDPEPWWWFEQIKARMALDRTEDNQAKPKG